MKYLEDKPFHVGDYKPNAEFCCEACVFGRGRHATFCEKRIVGGFHDGVLWRDYIKEIKRLSPGVTFIKAATTCFCPIENHNDIPDGPQCPQCGGLIQK